MFIYLIVNRNTGKYYVGQHKGDNLKKYLQTKLSDAKYYRNVSSRLFRSMRKHGREAFTIHALLSDVPTRTELDQYERDFISFLKSQDPEYGYNICRGGEGFSGPHSEASKKKIAAASHQMWQRPEVQENFSAKMRGRKRPPHVVQAISRAHLGTKATPETIEKLRNSHIGKGRSEASRKKQSESITGTKNHFYGKTHSEEFRLKRGRSVHCIDTNEVFPSLGHVVEHFGGNKSNISRAIRKGHLFLGKRFEYA